MIPITISTSFSLVEAAVTLFGNSAEKERKQRVSILLRKLYAETHSNLDIRDLVKKENLKTDWLKSIKAVAPLLKNETASLVLLGTENCFKELQIIQNDINDLWSFNAEAGDEAEEKYEAPVNFKQAVAFCANKIEILKSYAQIEEKDKDLFTTLVPLKRLANIHNYSMIIIKSLEAYFREHA